MLSYMHLVTNNRESLREGGVCIHCFKECAFEDITQWIKEKGGGLTAQCPHCEIDAVAPRGVSEDKLREWHREGFQQYITVDGY